jgi:hypothetical protein
MTVAAPGSAWADGALAPGGTAVLSVPLPGSWAAQVQQLGVSVVGLREQENGCLPQERKAGDTTCADDQGELAGQLGATVAAGRLSDGTCRADAATFDALDLRGGKPTVMAVHAGPGTPVDCVQVSLQFRDQADNNRAQSDSITFGLHLVAEGDKLTAGSVRDSTDTGTTGTVGRTGPSDSITVGHSQDPGGSASGMPRAGTVGAAVGARPAAGQAGAAALDGPILGEQTTPVRVAGDVVGVRTESSSRPAGEVVLAWGSLFLGLVVLGFLAFLWWRRRRQTAMRSVT